MKCEKNKKAKFLTLRNMQDINVALFIISRKYKLQIWIKQYLLVMTMNMLSTEIT